MKKTRKIRLLAFILTLCLILGALPLYVFADEVEEIPEELQDRIVEEIPFEPEYLPGDLTFAECRTATLNMAEVPAVISQAQIEQYQHVNRLYEQEPDLYTVIFQNRDGSKTVYVFAQPVKSVSGNGAVTDMSAAAIVSAHQPTLPSQNAMMQSSLSQNVAPILAMQERLNSYKAANDLKDYQMLDDVLEATTVSTSSAIVLNNSVSVASVSTTYSTLSDEYAIKLPNNTGYLTCEDGNISAVSAVEEPYGKWLFVYYAYDGYIIESLSNQGYCLSYIDGDSCSLFYEPEVEADGNEVLWTITEVDAGYTIECNGASLADSGNMVYDDEIYVCELTNYASFIRLTSVSLSSDVITMNVGDMCNLPSAVKSPSNASYSTVGSELEWTITDNSIVSYNSEEAVIGANSVGIAQIYLKHRYSSLESNRVTVIVSETPPAGEAITSGAVYLIRPYSAQITEFTPLLTMNVGSTSNTLSLSTWSDKWNSLSQAFTLTQNADSSYKISAIMAMNQYSIPFAYRDSLPYGGTYYLTDKDTVSNTLSRNGSAVTLISPNDPNGNNQLSQSEKWYIYKEDANYYIVNVAGNTIYYLSHNGNNVSLSTTKTSANWFISFFGIDTPYIRQVRNYYCSVATTLQVLIAINAPNYGYNINLCEAMENMETNTNIIIGNNGYIAYTDDKLNAVVDGVKYEHIEDDDIDDEDEMAYYLTTSLQNGSPMIASVNNTDLPYNAYSGGHFICIMGYDAITEKVLINDCTYIESAVGLHVISLTQLYNALNNGITYRKEK